MSLSSLYLLFFSIAVSGFAQTEASSVPVAVTTSAAASPVTFALLADQHQQNQNAAPVQKESSGHPLEQQKKRLPSVLTTAGTAAVLLAFAFVFIACAKQMQDYFAKKREEEEERSKREEVEKRKKAPLTPKEEQKLKELEYTIAQEDDFVDMDDAEVKIEARRRLGKIREIAWAKAREWDHQYTEDQKLDLAEREEEWQRKEQRKKEWLQSLDKAEREAWEREQSQRKKKRKRRRRGLAKARNRNS